MANDDVLDSILKKSQNSSTTLVLPEELSYLITAFLPESTTSRSKAYLILSAFCQGVRNLATDKSKPDPATESLVGIFAPLIVPRLGEDEENELLIGISFLTALFQVDWQCASMIFQKDGVLDSVMDSVDISSSARLSLHVAHLLGQASGHKSCRTSIASKSVIWLETSSRQTTDSSLRAAAAIALVKLSKGSIGDNADSGVNQHVIKSNDEELAKVMKGMVITSDNDSSVTDAVEGLAYMSVDASVKEALSKDPTFLKRLFSLVPRRKAGKPVELNSTLLYGILIIVSNICAYKPRLTEEQAQIEKLRRLAKEAKPSAYTSNDVSKLEGDEHVRARIRRLLAAGVLDILVSAATAESLGIRTTVGKTLLSVVEDKENRGKALQHGCGKALSSLIRKATPEGATRADNPAVLDPMHLQPIQALAKLAITASPVQVFGPNLGAVYDAIRPFVTMLLHPSSTLLQQFEALMALTNLSSLSAETTSRISQAKGLMNKVELLLLEDHPLLRRAAMELTCNLLAGSDDVFERYSGTENPSRSKSKLQVLLALADVEDLPTRLAASGAIATLTSAPGACQALVSLQLERHRVLPTIVQLIDPSVVPGDANERKEVPRNIGLVHRGVVCARNLLLSIDDVDTRRKIMAEGEHAGLLQALKAVVGQEGVDPSVSNTALEALAVLLESNNGYNDSIIVT